MYLVIQLGALIHATAAAENYSLALAKGVSIELVYSLISGAAGSSAQFNCLFPKMMAGDFSCGTSEFFGTLRKAIEDTVGRVHEHGRIRLRNR